MMDKYPPLPFAHQDWGLPSSFIHLQSQPPTMLSPRVSAGYKAHHYQHQTLELYNLLRKRRRRSRRNVLERREVLPIMCREIMPKADNLLITDMHHSEEEEEDGNVTFLPI